MICCFNTQVLQKSHWNVIVPMALNFLYSNCLLLSKLLLEQIRIYKRRIYMNWITNLDVICLLILPMQST